MTLDKSSDIKLKAIMRAARAILDQKHFIDAARTIFDQCCEMTGAVSGYVALLNEQGDENEVLFLEAGGKPCTVDPDLPMPIRGLRATAYETHKAVYHNDFMNSEWVKFMPAGHVVMHNVMFAPMNIDNKTVGILGLANKDGDFTDADAEIASVFGDLAAVALSNSRHLDLIEEHANSLQKALDEVQTLRGLLPICMNCKSILDDEGLWTKIETYLDGHTDATFSHSLCPDCIRELYPEDAEEIIRGQIRKEE